MRNKVLLINPVVADHKMFIRMGRCQTLSQPGIDKWPPVDLALIAASIEDVCGKENIILYDAQLDKYYSKMWQTIVEINPKIVILNCTTPTFNSDIALAKRIKEFTNDSLIIFFGLHATARPQEIMNSKVVDCCILYEPEDKLRAIVTTYLQRGSKSFDDVNGIFYLSNNDEIVETQTPITRNLNHSFLNRRPDRSLIKNEKYKLQYNNLPFTIIQTSRGCYNNCIFCTAPLYSDNYEVRTVESVLVEIDECINKYKLHQFMFLSDTFTTDRKWVEDLCQSIIQRKYNIKWMANTRADKIDYSLAKLMKDAGCMFLSIGIESSNDKILKNARKNISVLDVVNAVNNIKLAGIESIGYFIFGLPGETKESIYDTIRFSKSIPLDYAYFYYATPFPGTKLFKEAKENHWLISENWDKYEHGRRVLLLYPNLSRRILKRSVRKSYLSFYFRPKRILKQIYSIRTLSSLYNNIRAALSLFNK